MNSFNILVKRGVLKMKLNNWDEISIEKVQALVKKKWSYYY